MPTCPSTVIRGMIGPRQPSMKPPCFSLFEPATAQVDGGGIAERARAVRVMLRWCTVHGLTIQSQLAKLFLNNLHEVEQGQWFHFCENASGAVPRATEECSCLATGVFHRHNAGDHAVCTAAAEPEQGWAASGRCARARGPALRHLVIALVIALFLSTMRFSWQAWQMCDAATEERLGADIVATWFAS